MVKIRIALGLAYGARLGRPHVLRFGSVEEEREEDLTLAVGQGQKVWHHTPKQNA